MSVPISDDDALRVSALRALEIIGTPGSASFDAVVKLAADIFACPIAFISLLDKDQQWFKAECGLGTCSTPREMAFCNYTILGSDVFVVEDTLHDNRFARSRPLLRPKRARGPGGGRAAAQARTRGRRLDGCT